MYDEVDVSKREAYKETCRAVIRKYDALCRLKENKDFNLIFNQEEFKEEMLRLCNLLGTNADADKIMSDLSFFAKFNCYLEAIKRNAELAKSDYEAALEMDRQLGE